MKVSSRLAQSAEMRKGTRREFGSSPSALSFLTFVSTDRLRCTLFSWRAAWTFAGDQALEDRDMLAEHKLDLFGVEMALEGVMRREQRKLAALYRIVEQAVWAREDSVDMKVALEPFQLCGRRLAALHALYPLPLGAKVGASEIREGLLKRDRLQETAQFEMLTHLLGRQRSRIPAPVSILRHETDAIELRQHFVRHGAADAVIFREQALIELETAVLPEARDNMLDLGVDPCAAVAGGGFERFGVRQGQARFNQVEPAGVPPASLPTIRPRPSKLCRRPSSLRRRKAAAAGIRLDWKARATAASPITSPRGSDSSAICRRRLR